MNDYYDVRIKESNLLMLNQKYGSSGRLSIFRGDICDLDFIGNVFEEARPDYVCHLAARAGVRPSINDPYIYVHSNIEGTTRLLDLARLYRVKNFVYASSSSVYGSSGKEVLSEEDVVDKPVSPYAATKKACELLAYTFHHLYGLNATGLRFFTVYGPRGRPDMAPYKFIERVYNGEPIQQYGDGNTSRDYTYIADIVDGVVRSIDRPMGYQVFNLGNGRPRLLKDFITLVEECVGKKAIIEMLPEQPGDVSHTCADTSKAQRDLGYYPSVPFEEGIKLTSIWYINACKEGLIQQADAVLPPELVAPAMRSVSEDLEAAAAAEEEAASKGLRAKLIAIRQKLAGRLELDSNVQKARSQVTHRFERFLSEDKETEAILHERKSLEGLK
jgi:UDP-glucuronate 4-epimerase